MTTVRLAALVAPAVRLERDEVRRVADAVARVDGDASTLTLADVRGHTGVDWVHAALDAPARQARVVDAFLRGARRETVASVMSAEDLLLLEPDQRARVVSMVRAAPVDRGNTFYARVVVPAVATFFAASHDPDDDPDRQSLLRTLLSFGATRFLDAARSSDGAIVSIVSTLSANELGRLGTWLLRNGNPHEAANFAERVPALRSVLLDRMLADHGTLDEHEQGLFFRLVWMGDDAAQEAALNRVAASGRLQELRDQLEGSTGDIFDRMIERVVEREGSTLTPETRLELQRYIDAIPPFGCHIAWGLFC